MSQNYTFFGKIGRLRKAKIREFEVLCASPIPQVVQVLHACSLQNFSVFREEEIAFIYFEYVGDNYDLDMETLTNNDMMQRWWLFIKSCFDKLETHHGNEYYLKMKLVVHLD